MDKQKLIIKQTILSVVIILIGIVLSFIIIYSFSSLKKKVSDISNEKLLIEYQKNIEKLDNDFKEYKESLKNNQKYLNAKREFDDYFYKIKTGEERWSKSKYDELLKKIDDSIMEKSIK